MEVEMGVLLDLGVKIVLLIAIVALLMVLWSLLKKLVAIAAYVIPVIFAISAMAVSGWNIFWVIPLLIVWYRVLNKIRTRNK
jgi:hypothetical protein